jgi:ABC-2 type transport system permease protein
MDTLNKLVKSRYGWIVAGLFLVALNWALSLVHVRFDLTQEKRYTLSEPTHRLLKGLSGKVDVTVFLDGDIPAGFKKLRGSTADMLSSFKNDAGPGLQYRFTRPGEGLADSAKEMLFDSLSRLGINPTNVKAQTKEGQGSEEQLVFPGAVVHYKDRAIGIDFLQGQSNVDGLNSLNNAEALLEYKLAHAIQQVTQDTVPVIGYLIGNGEPFDDRITDLIENTLRPNYGFRFIPIDSVSAIPTQFSALLVVKPMKRFDDRQKLKIDQYVMHGGKVMWMLDALYASLDSLQRSEGQFIAFDMGLNLEDQLFRYGVRINPDLVQDVECDKIPSVVGMSGGKPQIQVLPWPYFPLLRNPGDHPVSKNLDYVVAQFPQSIDTVKAPGIRKTVLLSSSPESRILNAPARVEWASVRNEEDLKTFTKHNVPVAVLLEGRFNSIFANRISSAQADSMANVYHQPFLPQATTGNKMIVISDGDLPLNAVERDGKTLPMGMNLYTKQQYANREFLLNALEYLVDPSGILETRGKDYTLRLLDKKKVDEEKTFWQVVNIVLPILLVILAVTAYQGWRKRKYGRA